MRRLAEVAKTAPPDTAAGCELEIAHLLLLQEKWPEAEAAYGAWLEAWGTDERGDAARYWRAVALKELGREAEAEATAANVGATARLDEWRGPAALLAASLAAARGDRPAAARAYGTVLAAPWGAGVRAQALLGAAKTAATVDESTRYCRELTKRFPDAPEAEAARELLREPKRGGSRFGVQVGAYGKEANAKGERARWKKLGKPAEIVRREHAGFGRLYCVILGPYATFDAATRACAVVRAGGSSAQVTSY